jgi:hypothetical protein
VRVSGQLPDSGIASAELGYLLEVDYSRETKVKSVFRRFIQSIQMIRLSVELGARAGAVIEAPAASQPLAAAACEHQEQEHEAHTAAL